MSGLAWRKSCRRRLWLWRGGADGLLAALRRNGRFGKKGPLVALSGMSAWGHAVIYTWEASRLLQGQRLVETREQGASDARVKRCGMMTMAMTMLMMVLLLLLLLMIIMMVVMLVMVVLVLV